MLSLKSKLELLELIGRYGTSTIDRIFYAFDVEHLIHPTLGKLRIDDKLNSLLTLLKRPPEKGPFTNDFCLDLLQYMVDLYYRQVDNGNKGGFSWRSVDSITYENKFSFEHKSLIYCLSRDGYIVQGRLIKKQLPDEIKEAKSENELFIMLNRFSFTITRGHLEQAIFNHSQGNWAGANSQFRTFFESLLISICNKLLPRNNADNANTAITLLSKTVKPPFFREDLNEVENNNCKKPFVEGLWKRLHPEGSHPGLSDQEDSTFRYHITIVMAHYLLKRFEKWGGL
jgi:hypothetical protein